MLKDSSQSLMDFRTSNRSYIIPKRYQTIQNIQLLVLLMVQESYTSMANIPLLMVRVCWHLMPPVVGLGVSEPTINRSCHMSNSWEPAIKCDAGRPRGMEKAKTADLSCRKFDFGGGCWKHQTFYTKYRRFRTFRKKTGCAPQIVKM